MEIAVIKEIKASKSKEKEDKWSKWAIWKTNEKRARPLSPWFSSKFSNRFVQVHGGEYGLQNMGSTTSKVVGSG
jgi:hypothetical protein